MNRSQFLPLAFLLILACKNPRKEELKHQIGQTLFVKAAFSDHTTKRAKEIADMSRMDTASKRIYRYDSLVNAQQQDLKFIKSLQTALDSLQAVLKSLQ